MELKPFLQTCFVKLKDEERGKKDRLNERSNKKEEIIIIRKKKEIRVGVGY